MSLQSQPDPNNIDRSAAINKFVPRRIDSHQGSLVGFCPERMLADLASELLLAAADNLEMEADINVLAQTNRHFYELLNPYLYRRNAQKPLCTALFWAAGAGELETAQKAIAAGASIDGEDKRGRTPLFAACSAGREDMVKALLQTGMANPNKRALRGYTPLHAACLTGVEGIAKFLIDEDVDLNARDDDDETPLHVAASCGKVGFMKVLLETGKVHANVEGGEDSQTPFHYAIGHSQEDSVKFFFETMCPGREVLVWAWRIAAQQGKVSIMKLLLELGQVEADCRDPVSNCTPLMSAAREGRDEAVKFLLESGKVDVESKDIHGNTPLMHAAERGRVSTVKILLETGQANLEAMDAYGRMPFFLSVMWGKSDVVRFLLETGKVEIDWRDNENRTPLSWAVWRPQYKLVAEILLATGAVDVNAADDYYRTPLYHAVTNGGPDMTQLLLDYGANPAIATPTGMPRPPTPPSDDSEEYIGEGYNLSEI